MCIGLPLFLSSFRKSRIQDFIDSKEGLWKESDRRQYKFLKLSRNFENFSSMYVFSAPSFLSFLKKIEFLSSSEQRIVSREQSNRNCGEYRGRCQRCKSFDWRNIFGRSVATCRYTYIILDLPSALRLSPEFENRGRSRRDTERAS